MLPVDELVDEGAAFLAVDELHVDEDGPGGFIVEVWHACRQEHATDGHVEGVGEAAHPPTPSSTSDSLGALGPYLP